ncbi:hypothetical protein E2C01_096732 [Portunus trituberculatus]|uniref:Uncharacterized protein n=1 Tax=Portunus trituberculatus TaxID=210409 RepID=A0A5B7K3N8_PORTR|nr:hypothetical protein [Portunus trituberculatus]
MEKSNHETTKHSTFKVTTAAFHPLFFYSSSSSSSYEYHYARIIHHHHHHHEPPAAHPITRSRIKKQGLRSHHAASGTPASPHLPLLFTFTKQPRREYFAVKTLKSRERKL